MADQEDSLNEDQWLYGDGEEGPKDEDESKEPGEDKIEEKEAAAADAEPEQEEGEVNSDTLRPPGEEDIPLETGQDQEKPDKEDGEDEPEESEGQIGAPEDDEEDDDDDDSEDDIRVTIGDIKTAPQYSNLNIKRGAVLASAAEKLNKQQPGKFSIEEFESIGTINGIPAHEFSIDALEEKPWRKPGADITDYFNYGFNEDTWRAYCERQKQMRVHESGVGLGGLGVSRNTSTLTIINDNSKYSNITNSVMAGPPPGLRRSGVIDVIGVGGMPSRRTLDSPPKENAIQVMTAERRDYRKGFDMSVPPPGFDGTQPPPPMPPVVPGYPPTGYGPDFYNPEVETYYHYEPTQEVQWNQGRSSRHREKKSRSSLPLEYKRSKSDKYLHGPVNKETELPGGIVIKQEPIDKGYKERERDRERHKDRHRHRSRSRSADRERRRKHKSRSRSPGHRSHKKKKSKKSDRKDSE